MFDLAAPARSYANGRWLTATASGLFTVINPANLAEPVGPAAWASAADAAAAMEAAQAAGRAWQATPLAERVAHLRAVLAAVQQAAEPLAELITRENGKTLTEARGEVTATLRDGHYQLDHLLAASDLAASPLAGPGVRGAVWREPLGVLLLITPWNFPLATIGRKLIPSLALGNTAVVKPSELAPLTAAAFFQLLAAAGLPAGVANLVLGEGGSIGPSLVNHPALRGVSFTGSTAVGVALCTQTAARDVRMQMEMGGKNALVVLADADTEAALEAALTGAFACAGQWCTGTSRVIVEQPLYADFVARLAECAQALRVGEGRDPATQMGPVISAGQVQRSTEAIAHARAAGAQVVAGGRALPEVAGAQGHYLEPTVIAGVTAEMALAQQEVFGPVLAVLSAADPADALRLANHSAYGLAFSVYTHSAAWAESFMHEVPTGLCHVNLPTYYREAHLPVAGWQASGRGAPECGDFAVEAFTRVRAVYAQGLAG